MNALELAERVRERPQVYALAVADMLRKQNEAIKRLREALHLINDNTSSYDGWCGVIAEEVLKETEEFA